MPSVFGSLNENGYFYDPVERGKGFLVQPYKTFTENCLDNLVLETELTM